jgi:cytochrome c553
LAVREEECVTRVGAVVFGLVCFALGLLTYHFSARRVPDVPPPDAQVTESTGSGIDVSDIDFSQEPLWAYGYTEPPQPGDAAVPQTPPSRNLRPNEDPDEQTRPRRVEGSEASYSLVDVRDSGNVIDWFPGDHPPMPRLITQGPAAGVATTARGCASCHVPHGRGRPENAPVAALPTAYFVRQMQDFREGLRRTADPRKPNTPTMIQLAQAMTDEEIQIAAEYFGSIPWAPWVRVVETDLVPKTRIVGNLFLPVEEARTEPIAGRIIEVPEDEEQSETLRNPRSGFIAYAPIGSVARGEDLALTGGAASPAGPRTVPCGTCHGPDLGGVADIPPIAGRSPSYLVRQLWDMQQGTRRGALSQLMTPVVANLSPADMTDLAAYVASRLPSETGPATGQ